MASYYYGAQNHASHMNGHSSHNHHGGRSRRAPRISAANSHKQFRAVRSPKEVVESANVAAFRRDFEAARSFDLEDDELFCPFHLLTEDDVSSRLILPPVNLDRGRLNSDVNLDGQLQSIHSSGSDRSSLSSGSPESSPLQHQLQPTPSFVLSASNNNAYTPSSYQNTTAAHTKLHQPLAQRTRNAIPIVDPSTRNVASPPPSVSPARQMQQQFIGRRW